MRRAARGLGAPSAYPSEESEGRHVRPLFFVQTKLENTLARIVNLSLQPNKTV
jgi:hypothetical protein